MCSLPCYSLPFHSFIFLFPFLPLHRALPLDTPNPFLSRGPVPKIQLGGLEAL